MEKEVKTALAERLAALRQSSGLSQRDLAERLGIGLSALNEYEKGIRVPPSDRLLAIANFFSVSCDYLLGARVRVPMGMTLIDPELLNALRKAKDPEIFQRHVDNVPTMFLVGVKSQCSAFVFMEEGEAEKAYSQIFERAKKHAPTVVARWRRQHGLQR